MKRKKGFILTAAALSLSVLISGCAEAPGGSEVSFEEIEAEKLPSRVDLRSYEGKNYVTPVKSQNFGDCWAFALAASAETAYLFANDMGVPAGEVNDKADFSEKYIAWYVFHGITKDDVAKGRVRVSQVGEGFDCTEADNSNELSAYLFGGVFVGHPNLFGAGFGPVEESLSVKGEYPYAYNDGSSFEWSLPLNAEYRYAPSNAVLRNSRLLPSPAAKDENGGYVFSEEGLNAIKSELVKGHGVSVGVCSAGSVLNPENRTAYYNGDITADHGVAIIGYDDSFPKEKFTNVNFKDSTPPKDGAFIIKNSWGVKEGEEDDPDAGFLYISYYDHSLIAPMSYEFDKRDSVKHKTSNCDQYDLMMTEWYGSTDYETETKTANIFDAEEDESLFQIAYVTSQPKTEVSYEIFKDVEAGDPSSGVLLEKGVSCHTFGGWHRIDLRSEYALKKGESYSVVLTMKRSSDADGKASYTEVFPYSTEFQEGVPVRGIINRGESFLFADGKWSDMTVMRDSLTERAFSQGVEEVGNKKSLAPNAFESKDTFTVDNYPIKAFLTPADEG